MWRVKLILCGNMLRSYLSYPTCTRSRSWLRLCAYVKQSCSGSQKWDLIRIGIPGFQGLLCIFSTLNLLSRSHLFGIRRFAPDNLLPQWMMCLLIRKVDCDLHLARQTSFNISWFVRRILARPCPPCWIFLALESWLPPRGGLIHWGPDSLLEAAAYLAHSSLF